MTKTDFKFKVENHYLGPSAILKRRFLSNKPLFTELDELIILVSGARPVTFSRTLSAKGTYKLVHIKQGLTKTSPHLYTVTTPKGDSNSVCICVKSVEKYNLKGINYFRMTIKK